MTVISIPMSPYEIFSLILTVILIAVTWYFGRKRNSKK